MMTILNIIIAVQVVVVLVSLIIIFRIIKEINNMRLGFTLLVEKFFDQSNSNVKLIDRTINNASENMNSVLRSIQRVKRER